MKLCTETPQSSGFWTKLQSILTSRERFVLDLQTTLSHNSRTLIDKANVRCDVFCFYIRLNVNPYEEIFTKTIVFSCNAKENFINTLPNLDVKFHKYIRQRCHCMNRSIWIDLQKNLTQSKTFVIDYVLTLIYYK